MATNQSTIDYILDQLTSTGDVSARKMFGEYDAVSNHHALRACD
jgi:TfoX/Sxy family transcriptional regulator of competence genes